MLTRIRLPNPYRRSSRSNTELSRATVPFFEEWQLFLEPSCGFLPEGRRSKGVTQLGEREYEIPISR